MGPRRSLSTGWTVSTQLRPVGFLKTPAPLGAGETCFDPAEIAKAAATIRQPVHIVQDPGSGRLGLSLSGELTSESLPNGKPVLPLLATLPAIYPEWLGDRQFTETHGLRFPYIAGAMANGIATTTMVCAMARAGMLSFFGAAGLMPHQVEQAIDELGAQLGGEQGSAVPLPWGANLIHSPAEPQTETDVAALYAARRVTRVSASAYMDLSPALVRYAVTGLWSDGSGWVHRRHFVFAKISRPEVAERFMSPAPRNILDALLATGDISQTEWALAQKIPLAQDITVESDSGGHTDNRPLLALFPRIAALRQELTRRYGYLESIRLGAAGGIGTPDAAAAAFSLGAAYILTGSVNQSAVEAGLSAEAKELLCQADVADVIMAPAADMFELGVKLQVLRRGTMFGVRSLKLYDAYIKYDSLDDIPSAERHKLESTVLGVTCAEAWAQTAVFFGERAPDELRRAADDPKHKMALTFRWYLGLSSRWAIAGDTARRADYQVWCGPAMGAFNRWVEGSSLQAPKNRGVVQIGLNLLEGAASITRAHQLRTYGLPVPASLFHFAPRPLNLEGPRP